MSPMPSTAPRDEPKATASENDMEISHIERTLTTDDAIEKDNVNYDRVDKELAHYTSGARVEIDAATNNRLRKLIDRRILVVMVVTYFLQAIDKGTMSFASIMNIRPDLNLLDKQKFSMLTTCIYLAILVVEWPTNLIIQRVPIAKYLGINVMIWGSILALHAACKDFAGIVTVRTLLGIFEACCQPIFLVLSSMWYKRDEQTAIVTYWYMMNGAQQIVGGLLAFCFTLLKSGPLKSYQALFITYGCVSVLWGAFVLVWMPDSPMRAKCFTEADKHLMVERVRGNQTGVQNKTFRKEQQTEALLDPQTWCHALIAICTTLPTSGLGAFANIIILSFKFTVLQTQLLAMVLGAYIIIVLMSSTWLVKRTGQSLLVMLAFVLPSFAGTIVLMTVSIDKRVGLLISYYITFSFWSAQTLSLALISRNIAGQTKKVTIITVNFVSWAVGNAIGPQVFLDRDAPRYFIAFAVHIGCYTLLVAVILFLRTWLIRKNSQKEALAAAGIQEARDERQVHAFEDLTDRENPNFRYAI